MEVFRLTKEKFAKTLSGKGSAIKGARWNSAGVELIYTAGNRSLAMAEVAVHFTLATMPNDYVMITLQIPSVVKVKEINNKELPTNWNEFPHPLSTQRFGDSFVSENKICVLKVPSVVTQGDYNYLINPRHKDFSKIKILNIEKFPFDNRLFR